MHSVGNTIKQLRESYKMSQEKLGLRIGVKRAAVNKYEKGTVENIPIKTIEKIAKVFDTTPAFILGWEDKSDWQEQVATLTYETKVLKGVDYFYGKEAVQILELLTHLNKTGVRRATQYLEELCHLYSQEKSN